MPNSPKPGVSCPDGGAFYICQNNATEFVGCCTIDPCADGSGECLGDKFRPASFFSNRYKDIPAQECITVGTDTNWYVCANNKTTFMGCCHHADPCLAGVCQAGYLVHVQLSGNKEDRETFMEILKEETPTSTSVFTAPVASPGSSSSSLGPAPANATSGTGSNSLGGGGGPGGLHAGAIAGIAIIATVAIIAILAFLVFRRHRSDEPGDVDVGRSFRRRAGRSRYSAIPSLNTPITPDSKSQR
jgi:hypothetical protein